MWLPVGPTEGWNCGASKGKQKREEVFSPVPLEDGGLGFHADIDSLEPGNEYLLRVIANNSLGSSPASDVCECLRPHQKPFSVIPEGRFRESGPRSLGCMGRGEWLMFLLAIVLQGRCAQKLRRRCHQIRCT